MGTKLVVIFWVMLASLVIAMNVMCADLSPQHADFLKTLFWDLPCMVIERIVPFYGS